jgi:hypothetical protein
MARKIILRQVPGGEGDERDRNAASRAEMRPERPVTAILAEIKQLYFKTTAATIERDFDRAIDLLKTIPMPEDRQRATVYMDGLAEMKREWRQRTRRR